MLLFCRDDKVFIRRHAFAIHKYSPFTSKSNFFMLKGKKEYKWKSAYCWILGEMKAKKKEITNYFKSKIWLHLENSKEGKCNLLSSNNDRLVSFVSTSVIMMSQYKSNWMFFRGFFQFFSCHDLVKKKKNHKIIKSVLYNPVFGKAETKGVLEIVVDKTFHYNCHWWLKMENPFILTVKSSYRVISVPSAASWKGYKKRQDA